ncbi:carbohydrate ABC transporter permease [Actinocatenispora rupis]|uniref:ABC transporter permease n=1 Tax=Actinocatenispora rupis TaxID=519421 RepID=A0A8J3NC06_9ACTN|nr:sugar ABC transporter permease [Actinocatenispora rupis]GID11345.1 ABC transporter permease [Actinocatenispora rupis]
MTTTVQAPRKPATAGRARKNRRNAGTGRFAALLLSPTVLVLALVIGYPIVSAVRLSFLVTHNGINPTTGMVENTTHVGVDNYAAIFSGDTASQFWNAFWNTTTFTVAGVFVETVLGVLMALIMNRAFRGRGLVRASVLVPWAIPTAISGLLWKWIFQSEGIANTLLHTHILWTTEGFHAWVAVLVADVWKTAPFIGLLALAGLQMIPGDVYEAAKVDGSGPWRTFWRITLPLARPALVVAVLFRMLDALRMFDLPFVLIGAHKHSVETLSTFAWYEASNLRYGSAAAYSTVLFLYIALVAFVFVKVLGADLVGRGVSGRKS